MRFLLVVVLGCGFLAGCSSKIDGELRIDDEPFAIEKCRSGQAFGFAGIQFNGKDDRRLRVIALPDGTAEAVLFAAGSETGTRLGACGTLTMKAQNSRINNITNLEGNAKLSCSGGAHRVSGQLAFENCH